jgi:hypothetical protein
MPAIGVVIFAEEDGSAPLLDWLDRLPPKAQDKCVARVELLKERGFGLRRPHADYLESGIYELRIRHLRVHYRILYGFSGRRAVLALGLTKTGRVPDSAIAGARRMLDRFESDPASHSYVERQQ